MYENSRKCKLEDQWFSEFKREGDLVWKETQGNILVTETCYRLIVVVLSEMLNSTTLII